MVVRPGPIAETSGRPLMKQAAAFTAALIVGTALVMPTESASATARSFKNCTAMHRVYPHGVGRLHAHDKTSGTPVTNFKHSNALYRANSKSDRDGDHIACEQR
jgi:hypothetical protein